MNTLDDIKLLLATMYRDASNARHQLATLFKPGEKNNYSATYDSLGGMRDELAIIYACTFSDRSLESDWLYILNKLENKSDWLYILNKLENKYETLKEDYEILKENCDGWQNM